MSTIRLPTRVRILTAATDLFGLRGVDAVSLDQIATEVGVAKQTLLYWFPSKDELVEAVLLEACLLYTSPSPRDRTRSRMPSSA